jgi:phospholipase C
MMLKLTTVAAALLLAAAHSQAATPNYDDVQTIVVIYAENRSFDNLYGSFPGADGLANAPPTASRCAVCRRSGAASRRRSRPEHRSHRSA